MFNLIEKGIDIVLGADKVKDFSDRPEVPPWKKPERKLTDQEKEILRRLFK